MQSNFYNCKCGILEEKCLRRIFKSPRARFLVGYLTRAKLFLGIANSSLEVVNIDGDNLLKVPFKKDKFGPFLGCNWCVPIEKAADHVKLTYEVFVPDDFNFVKGGKLPGIAGGTANVGGNKPDGKNGWSVRLMFKEDGIVCGYLYYVDMPGEFGEKKFLQVNGQLIRLVKGDWNTIAIYVKMNHPSNSNGLLKIAVNGEIGLDSNSIRYRISEKLKIDQLLFSTFFGGDDSTWAPPQDEYLLFNNFKVDYL